VCGSAPQPARDEAARGWVGRYAESTVPSGKVALAPPLRGVREGLGVEARGSSAREPRNESAPDGLLDGTPLGDAAVAACGCSAREGTPDGAAPCDTAVDGSGAGDTSGALKKDAVGMEVRVEGTVKAAPAGAAVAAPAITLGRGAPSPGGGMAGLRFAGDAPSRVAVGTGKPTGAEAGGSAGP
jgi:hypothetical protein